MQSDKVSNQVRIVSDIWKFRWTVPDVRRQTESLFKGSCQFLGKECAQYLEDQVCPVKTNWI